MADLSGYGFAVRVPAGWEAEIYSRAPDVAAYGVDPDALHYPPIVHLATFALPPERGDFGGGALGAMSGRDAFISVVEYERRDAANAQDRLRLLQDRQVPLSEQVARAAELGYAKGALPLLELLDARRVLRQARLDLLAARADLARAAVARDSWIASQAE